MPIFEFMGLPGSGKSTQAKRLLKERPDCVCLHELYWECVRSSGSRGILERMLSRLPLQIKMPLSGPMSRLDLVHRFMSEEPEYSRVVFSELSQFPSKDLRMSFLHAWLKYAAERELVLKTGVEDHWVTVEEGFAHRAMTLFGYQEQAPSADRIEAYVTAMPKPERILWVDTPVEICSERLKKRSAPPLPLIEISKHLWPDRLAVGRDVLSMVKEALQQCGVHVISLSPEATLDDSIKQIPALPDSV